MKIIADNLRIPILTWCDPLPAGVLKQATNLAGLPVAFNHVALMPDCHSGYGMPIGGVVACNDAVIPHAVGVDIGCGMCAVQTDIPAVELHPERVASLLREIKSRIPLGFDHHQKPQSWDGFDRAPAIRIIREELESARRQLGSLGGGNHFIELQKDDRGRAWLMLHSGSRNFGLKIADEYHRKAMAYCSRRGIEPPDRDLSYFPADSDDGREYLEAMNYALSFAAENRRRMKEWCLEILDAAFPSCSFVREINIHHNFAAKEQHFGREVVVHRKGATQAFAGMTGIIPGSMGRASYIVRGLGNPDSFMSCSHGAGRAMGRNEANRSLSVVDVKKAMKGVVYDLSHDRKGRVDLSEAPQAYKNIDEVMDAQKDLVEIETKLRPLGVVKG